MKPSDFEPMHNGERFQVRQVSVMGGRSEWQVYADGLQHIASCCRAEIADMIAKCLNDAACQRIDILGNSETTWFTGMFRYAHSTEGMRPRQVEEE